MKNSEELTGLRFNYKITHSRSIRSQWTIGGSSGDLLSLTEIYKQTDTGDQGNYQVKAYERFLKWLHTHINTHRSIKQELTARGSVSH